MSEVKAVTIRASPTKYRQRKNKTQRCWNLILVFCAISSTRISVSEAFQATFSSRRDCRCRTWRLNLAPQQLGSFETLEDTIKENKSKRRVLLEDLVSSEETIDFETAWDLQKVLVQEHVQRLTECQDDHQSQFLPEDFVEVDKEPFPIEGGVDSVFMLEHAPIYTLGTGSDEKFILGSNSDVPTIRMDRGGEVTYHGPGQLVVYPVLDLRSYKQDIHWYMRALEESVLRALEACGVEATRHDDTTGIWVDNHKVAAVGVKCRKWITMHGLAVNIEADSLANFQGIVPCGLEGRKVGCVNQFLTTNQEPLTVQEFSKYMRVALEDVFQIELAARTHETMPSSSSRE